jgi:O-antigen ligase
MGCFALLLLPTVVLLKSTGALALGVVGCAILWAGKCWPSRVWLLLLLAVPPLYAITRTSGAWTGEGLVELAKANVGNARAQSLEFRLENEERLIGKALQRPLFGWGGWGRARVYDGEGNDRSTTDGLWIIALGDRGVVGLVALGGVLLLPVLRFAFLFPPRRWGEPLVAPLTACAVVVALWAIDCLLNAGFNHVYLLMAGGLVGMSPGRRPEARPRVSPGRRSPLRPHLPLAKKVPPANGEPVPAARPVPAG